MDHYSAQPAARNRYLPGLGRGLPADLRAGPWHHLVAAHGRSSKSFTNRPIATWGSSSSRCPLARCLTASHWSGGPSINCDGRRRVICRDSSAGGRPGTRAEPEPEEQQDYRHHKPADAIDDECDPAVDMPDQPSEILAEEAGDECERQEDRGQDRELLDAEVLLDADLRLLDRDHRHVGLQYRAEQVTLVGYLLVDLEKMIPDVAQVMPQLLVGQTFDRGCHPEQRVDGAVEVGDLLTQGVD